MHQKSIKTTIKGPHLWGSREGTRQIPKEPN